MGGIYIHVPFCKQACHYCDFHFSTSLKKKDEMIFSLRKELNLRRKEFESEKVETIYFGGGTPSVLEVEEIVLLINEVKKLYDVIEEVEITLEANPDDLDLQMIQKLAKTPVNRLSIGIQSFFDEDLKIMNRAHNAKDAEESILNAKKYFDNITIDLIYGMPNMSIERWKENIFKALSFHVPHISSYALTVEHKTALETFINKGKIIPLAEEIVSEHFYSLVEILEQNGFVHYELSNFGKPTFFSKNNSAYWQGKKYIGIGPSAHSFDGKTRSWNVANNAVYIKSLKENKLPLEKEELTLNDQYNEYVMTGLRTIWGVSLDLISEKFGKKFIDHILKESEFHLQEGRLILEDGVLKTTHKGKFLCDGIASDLFFINLNK